MDTVELLAKFADPDVMKSLSIAERMTAGLITTVLGMGITFISLIILQFVISLMARMTSEKAEKVKEESTFVAEERGVPVEKSPMQDEEIIAAITTALAIQLKTSVSKIVIKNIERVEESSSAWHRAGIAEQVKNSL